MLTLNHWRAHYGHHIGPAEYKQWHHYSLITIYMRAEGATLHFPERQALPLRQSICSDGGTAVEDFKRGNKTITVLIRVFCFSGFSPWSIFFSSCYSISLWAHVLMYTKIKLKFEDNIRYKNEMLTLKPSMILHIYIAYWCLTLITLRGSMLYHKTQ